MILVEIPRKNFDFDLIIEFLFSPHWKFDLSFIWIFFSGKTSQETHDEEDEEEEDDNNSSNDETSDSDDAMQVN